MREINKTFLCQFTAALIAAFFVFKEMLIFVSTKFEF